MEDKLVKLYATRARLNAQLQDPSLRQDQKLCTRLCKQLEEIENAIDKLNIIIYGGAQDAR